MGGFHVKRSYHTPERDIRKLLEVQGMFITLVVVIVSRVCAFIQTHQAIHIKLAQFFDLSIIPQKLF